MAHVAFGSELCWINFNLSSSLFGDTIWYPIYRVRLYPPFGYSILYKVYDLTGFNHQKTLLT